MQNPVRVDAKCDLNFGDAAQGLGDVLQCEFSQVVVVLDHGPLTLIDLDVDMSLVVFVGGEVLALICGQRGVAVNQGLHHTTRSLQA
mmetsp:Transcript_91681/g.191643  ORF Transcript_91681/g.191643 Transcript_91681/m.191643 type:complete len:87 (+) Transcript_91681:971-1231(+)